MLRGIRASCAAQKRRSGPGFPSTLKGAGSGTLIRGTLGKSLTLLIPGLFGPAEDPSGQDQAFPALESLLARAEPAPGVPPTFDQAVFALFGIDAPADADLPVAAVTRALDIGVIDKGWWLRADPVHLRPERDRLILLDAQLVPLSQEEATRLAAEVLEHYAADGWALKAPRPGRWYLKPPRAARIVTTPLAEVVGKDIHPYLPTGKEGKAWHTVLNEIQILLHTATVNSERESRGELPINSLWFWGSGRLPNISPVEWAQVHSEEPISLALARLSETPSSASPESFSDWQRQSQRSGHHLVVLDGARGAVQYHDVDQWRTFVERLEREWIAPLLGALKDRALAEVTIYTDTSRAFRLSAGQSRRWWRRRRSLGSFR